MELLREFGPDIGVPLFFVWWLGRRLDRAMDDLKELYREEIHHLRDQNDKLLDRLIGVPSPSPWEAPDIGTLRQRLKQRRLSQGELFDDE